RPWAVSASQDATLKVWDLQTGGCLRTLEGDYSPAMAVAAYTDHPWAVSASRHDMLKVWDLETGACLRTLESHPRPVLTVAVCADRPWAISASMDATLKVWDLQTGGCLGSFHGDSAVMCCALASGGKTVVAGEASGRVHVLRPRGFSL
ncbi:MAG: hypothetical protein JW809_11195, partial [Pirellulales bacterium]|nr:hypothetical protein [Pirellulales bacterium]